MKIAILAGSHRVKSQSSKVAQFVRRNLESTGNQVYPLDLRGNPLPLWEENSEDKSWSERWKMPVLALCLEHSKLQSGDSCC